jgi:hypothetical protein
VSTVTVDTLATTPVSQGYLASSFKTMFRNPTNQKITAVETVTDEHTQVGAYYLLSSRQIESLEQEQNPSQIRIQFENFQLGKK